MGQIGETIGTSTWNVKTQDLVNYAWVSGDINPIHFCHDSAKELGLPGTIVHGLFAHAKLIAEISAQAKKHNLGSVQETHTKFAGMMPCPGTYKIEIAKNGDGNELIGRVLNGEDGLCVEVRAVLKLA
jgi:acyl dehydratase